MAIAAEELAGGASLQARASRAAGRAGATAKRAGSAASRAAQSHAGRSAGRAAAGTFLAARYGARSAQKQGPDPGGWVASRGTDDPTASLLQRITTPDDPLMPLAILGVLLIAGTHVLDQVHQTVSQATGHDYTSTQPFTVGRAVKIFGGWVFFSFLMLSAPRSLTKAATGLTWILVLPAFALYWNDLLSLFGLGQTATTTSALTPVSYTPGTSGDLYAQAEGAGAAVGGAAGAAAGAAAGQALPGAPTGSAVSFAHEQLSTAPLPNQA